MAEQFGVTSQHMPLAMVVDLPDKPGATLFVVGFVFDPETGTGEAVVALGDGLLARLSTLADHGVSKVHGLGPVQMQRQSPLAVPGLAR